MKRELGFTNSAVFLILAINIIVYFLQDKMNAAGVLENFVLIPRDVFMHGKVWQLFTYMFVHGGTFHIIFNMYVFFIFGQIVEHVWGSGKFLFYYLFCGIGAGICIAGIAYLSQGKAFYIPTVGASGAVYGVMLAFAMLFPNQEIQMLFPPVSMKAKHLIIMYGCIALISEISQIQNNISHIGHLGGIVFGLVYFFTIHKIRPIHTRKFNSKLKNAQKKAMKTEKEKMFSKENIEIKKNIIRKLQENSSLDVLTDDEFQYIKYLDIMVDTEEIKHKYVSDILSKEHISDKEFLVEIKKYISFSDS